MLQEKIRIVCQEMYVHFSYFENKIVSQKETLQALKDLKDSVSNDTNPEITYTELSHKNMRHLT